MDGGQALVRTLIEYGVDTAFSVPGESYLPILRAIQNSGNAIKLVTPRHESGVTFAAEAFGKLAGRPAAGFVSRGPGATNASIGVHTASQDSTPLLLFVGHVPTATKGREAFQEIDYHQMFGKIAKAVLEPETSAQIPEVVARAVTLTTAGRPGPVIVVMPKDITEGDAGDTLPPTLRPRARAGMAPDDVTAAAALINQARKPVLIAGEMISIDDATPALVAFAEASGVAVAAAYRRQDTFPNEHAAYFGHLEINRVAFQREAFEDADLIIAMGCRLDGISTQEFTIPRADQTLIHVFPDREVLARGAAEVAAAADVIPALQALTEAVAAPSPERLAWRNGLHAAFDAFARPGTIHIHGQVDLAACVAEMQSQVPDDAVILTDSGTFARWVHRYYRFNRPHTQAGPMSGAMGYATPGGIGAALAKPNAPAVAFVGDGGFLMSGQELVAAVQHRLKLICILCDNGAWGSIMVSQQRRYGEEGVHGTRLQSPDFAKVAEGYGMPSFRVERTRDFAPAFAKALATEGPALLHLLLDERDISPFTDEVSV
ncbi:MAG: thiamine pyrophosphate-binding protein [Alphaproteobacteria bacterium]|nr:thiamine pyrophosphate-binding protein [Alphaproteobacteria bacterium]MCB9931277.1 thiamine pyrophosphate-binding protein [Alphaproteobacteria bacterium]